MRAAHAKVNLWLNVVGRRADGYHLLDSLVAFVDLADTIAAQPADRLSLELAGPSAAALTGDADNLVLKAARLLADRAGVSPRAAIRLEKRIPVAAGLGGGSADAAAALRMLVDLWRVALPEEELFDLAATLGADVPMCLAGRTAVASGVGERLQAAPALPRSKRTTFAIGVNLLRIWPSIELSTATGQSSPTKPSMALQNRPAST